MEKLTRDIITNKEIYIFFKETLGWNRIKVDRKKVEIKRRLPEVRGYPLKYKGGDWILSKKDFFEYLQN